MGRSEGSRNRVFEKDAAGKVWTVAADPSKVADPTLLIYTAMLEDGTGMFAVSNGVQTGDLIVGYEGLSPLGGLRATTFNYDYEPDGPHFTPRISAICSLRDKRLYAEMSIIKKSAYTKDPERHFYPISEFFPGIGFCISTYKGPGDPLPSFEGSPYPVLLMGDLETVAQTVWNALDGDNLISMAVKFIPIRRGRKSQTLIINKYQKRA